ncbi:MAG: hypothetical protein H0W70_00310, partial [Actinobacteria bacterium]|nr:hypothetical protein [Actinomycetota bacterium]
MSAFTLVGLSVGVIVGLAGQLSLGQFAIAGAGATASALVARQSGNFMLAFLAAGLVGAVASVAVGLPALRIRGLFLAITTIGVALVAQNSLFGQSWALGNGLDPGRPVIAGHALDGGRAYFYFSLFVVAFGFWFTRNIWRSGLGRRLRALRDNEDGARSFTVPATAVKLQAFALAGFLAGVGGAVYGHGLSRISPSTFPVEASISVVALTLIGGVGILVGPLIGALYIIGVPHFVPLDSAGLAASSLGWLVLILYFPGGIAQLIRPVRDRLVDLLARRAGVDVDDGGALVGSALESAADITLQAAVVQRSATDPEATVLLDVRSVSKRFGGVTAVDEVSLDVVRGET